MQRTFGLILLLLSIALLGYGARGKWAELSGRVIPVAQKLNIPWRTVDQEEVENGISIPKETQVILHLPEDMGRITREVLLGHRGKDVRYWGYCFPEEGTEPVGRIVGYPGKMFLSEAERAVRLAKIERQLRPFSIFHPPTKRELARKPYLQSPIRHQLEIFLGGTTCYVHAAESLPVGTDPDKDLLNSLLERENGTDPHVADTDGDGLSDGIEVLRLRSDPLRRDTDADGLIDGIEDRNRNGRLDGGETNPLAADSDRDGLCDGYCRVKHLGRTCADFAAPKSCIPAPAANWRGEDKNLNGIVDEGEYDPLNPDTDDDGILDETEYYNCLLEKKTGC